MAAAATFTPATPRRNENVVVAGTDWAVDSPITVIAVGAGMGQRKATLTSDGSGDFTSEDLADFVLEEGRWQFSVTDGVDTVLGSVQVSGGG